MVDHADIPGTVDLDAERYVLGACVVWPEEIKVTQSILGDVVPWTQDNHRALWSALLKLDESGTPILPSEIIKLTGREEVISPFIDSLVSSQIHGTEIPYYAKRIISLQKRRAVGFKAMALMDAAANGTVNGELEALTAACVALNNLDEDKKERGPKSLQSVLALAEVAGRVEILPTCFPGLPDGVGHAAGRITIIGAFTGSGKTTTLTAESSNFASLGHPVLFSTVELSNVEVARKMSSSLAPSAIPLIWIDEPSSIGELTRNTEAWAEGLDGGKAPVLCLDFIQRLRSDDHGKGNREREVALVAEALSTLARRLGIVVIAAAQLNRASQNESRPSLHHLRESGALEQCADLALLIGSAGENRLYVLVAKNRWGAGSGEETELEADFSRCSFRELSPIVRLQPLAVEIVDYLKAHGNTAQIRDISRNVKIPGTKKHPKTSEITQAGMICKLFTIDGNTIKLL